MRIKENKKAIISLLKVKLLKKRIPLAVRWQLTNRCVLRCEYCNLYNQPKEEISFDKFCFVLDQLAAMGTETISFSGGEPMLRSDIAEILEYTKKRGISTEMNSTGAMIPQNISKLKNLDFLKLSLDGPCEANDAIRGRGAFEMVMKAAEFAQKNKIHFIFTTTLTKHNVDQVQYLVSIAEKYDTLVAFQPLKDLYRGAKDIKRLYPARDEFQEAINRLIKLKKGGNRHLRNSLIGLYHIYNWPDYKKLNCYAGKIFCMIDAAGTLQPCDRISYNTGLPNCLEGSLQEAFLRLPEVSCSGCGFCGVLELNFLLSLRLNTIKSILSVIK